MRKTASLERHSLSLALRKQCKWTEAGSKIRGKYVCVSFPRDKHVSRVCSFPREKNERTTKVKEGVLIRKDRARHMKKENHLMLARFKESSKDLLLNYPSFFPTSSFTFPSAFVYLLFTFCSLTFPFFHFWVHFEVN